ncbi:MAG: type II secretion system protein GspD, partial [Planctomycetota bacterium]
TKTIDQAYDAGITLTITPHISKGNNLKLDISLERKDFGAITGTKPPDTANNNINTIVTVPDNVTIILGGMERLNQGKSGTKIPLLGDIPLIGGLFRGTDNSDIQKRLYVFVKAHILRPGSEQLTGESDVEMVSRRNRDTFEKYEREMQEYEDWPGIMPEPMDPLRILEEDVR